MGSPRFTPYVTQDVQVETPWYHATVVHGETLRFERFPDDLPREAGHEKAMVGRTGLKSNLTVPIAVGGRHVLVLETGAIREFRAWPDEVVERVRLVGQILASGLHRKRVESELRAANAAAVERARAAARGAPGGDSHCHDFGCRSRLPTGQTCWIMANRKAVVSPNSIIPFRASSAPISLQ